MNEGIIESSRSGAIARAFTEWLLPLGVALAAGLFYWCTLAPGTVYLQDVAEFQMKLHTLDVIHATGYPIYQMVGKLWTMLLPLGSIAWRVNLLSAFFSVMTLLAVCRIMQQIDVRPWAIVGACAVLACSRLFWTYSILASTYSFHVAFVAFSILSLLRWQAGRDSGSWFALTCGVGLAHHRVFVVVLPVFAFAILLDGRTRSQLRDRCVTLITLLIVPSLLSYVWLASRGVWPPGRLFDYLFVDGAAYVGHVSDVTSWTRRLRETILPWLTQFSGPFPALIAVVGWLVSLRPGAESMRRRTGILALVLGIATLGFFSVAWIAPDNRRYFLQLDLVLALGWGLALDAGGRWIRRQLSGEWLPQAAQASFVVLACVPVIWQYPVSFEALARYRDGYADRISRRILATVEQGATVFGGWVLGWPLRYYTMVEDLRPDVQVVVEPGGGHHRDMAIDLIESGKPVYFVEPLYGLDRAESGYVWAPLATGGLARALPSTPGLAYHEELDMTVVEDGPILRSAGLSSWPLRPDTFVQLQLAWERTDEVEDEARIQLKLKDPTGVTQWDHRVLWSEAGNEESPMRVHWVTRPTLLPGDHVLQVELVSPTGESLGEVQIAPIRVAPGSPLTSERLVLDNPVDPEKPIPSESPELWLVGYTPVQQEIWVGHHQIPVALYWEAAQAPTTLNQLSLAVEDRDSHITVSDSCPVVAPYPGALLRTLCTIQVPNKVSTGHYQLIAELSDGENCWTEPLQGIRLLDRSRVYRVPRVHHPLSVSLGGDISLLGYDLSSETARPGEDLAVTLYWQAKSDGKAWFKVFTHLVGPDGALVAQHDGVPDLGAAPTSEWIAGEVIVDDHTLTIPPNAAGGSYRVYVGMYSPETGERLVAQDDEGESYPGKAVPLGVITVDGKQW